MSVGDTPTLLIPAGTRRPAGANPLPHFKRGRTSADHAGPTCGVTASGIEAPGDISQLAPTQASRGLWKIWTKEKRSPPSGLSSAMHGSSGGKIAIGTDRIRGVRSICIGPMHSPQPSHI